MSDASDPYLYPGTDVLRNIPGLRDAEQLAAFEAAKTAQRIYQLLRTPIDGRFDAVHLKAIHKQVFQDVFPWARLFRTTVLGKAEHIARPLTWFTPPHLLDHEAERIFGTLHVADLLRGLGQPEFAQQGARLLSAINKLHPFREGNGRTQRIFLDALARQAGHQLHFDVVSRERMMQASILANSGKDGMTIRMFEEISDAGRVEPLRRAIAFLSREKFNWNETYIATITAGESYAGKLAGRDGDAFMMRSDDDHIFIGRRSDIPDATRVGEPIAFRARHT